MCDTHGSIIARALAYTTTYVRSILRRLKNFSRGSYIRYSTIMTRRNVQKATVKVLPDENAGELFVLV